MKKKIISLMLVLAMLLAFVPAAAFAADDDDCMALDTDGIVLISPNPVGDLVIAPNPVRDITVYVTIGINGEFAKSKDGAPVAQIPVTLSGKALYTLDDALKAAHEQLCEDGASAYGMNEVGAYITKLWGDESGNFNYQVNKGAVDVWDVNTAVNDGDYVDAHVNKSYWPDNEDFSRFDVNTKTVAADMPFELVLEKAGFDENLQMIFSALEGANITVDGELLEGAVTDAEGKVSITLKEGTYIISAKKTKTVADETVPAIEAPACVITAKKAFFKDTNVNGYYYDALAWAVANNMVTGYPDGRFASMDTLTRAAAITLLYRRAGSPDVTGLENPFDDIKESDYFYNAAIWAYANGYVKGTGNGKFSPDILMNGAMTITLLYNYVKPEDDFEKLKFDDVPEDAYYAEAASWGMYWEKKSGYMRDEEFAYNPEQLCQRGFMVFMLYIFTA